ncbi:unnamed protein product, partial [Rotaria magnacalcarata]
AQLLMSRDVNWTYARDTLGRTVLNTGVIALRLRSAKVTAMLRNLSECLTLIPGCDQWRHKWGHEQTAFSEYYRDAFIPDVELISVPCNEGLGYSGEAIFGCTGRYIAHVTTAKQTLSERYKQRLLDITMLMLEHKLFLSHVSYPATNDIHILDSLRRL